MKKLLLATSAFALMAGPALAADLPTRAAPAAPFAAPPVFTWTGLYVGANAGYTWGTARFSDTDGDGFSRRIDGALGGAQVGYNWQAGDIVFGVESDIQATGISRSVTSDGTTLKSEIPYFGTVRGRIGMSFDNIMPYVTAGLAYANNKITVSEAGVSLSNTKTHFGWTVGAGIEAALGNGWSVKGEYLYVDLQNKTYFANFDGGFRARADFHIARVGVNYRF